MKKANKLGVAFVGFIVLIIIGISGCSGSATPSGDASSVGSGSPVGSSAVTTPAPTTPTLAATGTTGAYSCTSNKASGVCGPYDYPQNTDSNGYNTYTNNDVWNPPPGFTGQDCRPGSAAPCQTLHSNEPGDFVVTANMPAGNTAVLSYPSTSQLITNNGDVATQPVIANMKSITSSFSENMNATSQTFAEAGYDLWTGDGTEIMIQNDFAPAGPNRCSAAGHNPVLATVNFTEPSTGTRQAWDFCPYGSEQIWQLHGTTEQSGSVDILAMLMWMEHNGHLAASSTFAAAGYGWEINSTGGQYENFVMSGYSLTVN